MTRPVLAGVLPVLCVVWVAAECWQRRRVAYVVTLPDGWPGAA
jgi:hypothetical protein